MATAIPEPFLIEIAETVHYAHNFTRDEVIQYVGEDTLIEHLGLESEEALAGIDNAELAEALKELAENGQLDTLEEEMQPYGDVQGSDWTFTLV